MHACMHACIHTYIHTYILIEPDPRTAHQPQVFHRRLLMPGMHGPLGFTTGGPPAATPARPQLPPPKGAPWLPTAGHGRVDSTPTLAAGHFILHHQVDFSSCTPGRHLRLGLVTQQGPSRARSAGRSAVLGGKPQQVEFKAIPRHIHTYIHTYIHTCITSHHITSHHITSHHITLHHITLHHITLHYITLHHITLYYVTLHCVTLRYVALRYITLHYITYVRTYIHTCMHACIHICV